MHTIPSLFSQIVLCIIQQSPHSIMNIPSHLPPEITFLMMHVFNELMPPRAIFALILSVISFFSMEALLDSTNKIPFFIFFHHLLNYYFKCYYLLKILHNLILLNRNRCFVVTLNPCFFIVGYKRILFDSRIVVCPFAINSIFIVTTNT